MQTCIRGTLTEFFEDMENACDLPMTEEFDTVINEHHKYQNFVFKMHTLLYGGFNSFLYFNPKLTSLLRFNKVAQTNSRRLLAQSDRVTVGIHVQRGEMLTYAYLRFPRKNYFQNAMHYFYSTFRYNIRYVVISDDPKWCSQHSENIQIADEPQSQGLAMAMLSNCDHAIISIGYVGWWKVFLGRGDVVYSNAEIDMTHPYNKGNVVLLYVSKPWKDVCPRNYRLLPSDMGAHWRFRPSVGHPFAGKDHHPRLVSTTPYAKWAVCFACVQGGCEQAHYNYNNPETMPYHQTNGGRKKEGNWQSHMCR